MYLLPVSRDVPNSCLSCCTYVWCIQVWCICFLKNAWCTYFPCCKMYLLLMYLIPVTQFLNDVPTSGVSKSVTSLRLYYTWSARLYRPTLTVSSFSPFIRPTEQSAEGSDDENYIRGSRLRLLPRSRGGKKEGREGWHCCQKIHHLSPWKKRNQIVIMYAYSDDICNHMIGQG